MDPPYWGTSVVHQYGGRKILLTFGTEQNSIYINKFPATLTSQMAKKKKKDKRIFFDKKT